MEQEEVYGCRSRHSYSTVKSITDNRGIVTFTGCHNRLCAVKSLLLQRLNGCQVPVRKATPQMTRVSVLNPSMLPPLAKPDSQSRNPHPKLQTQNLWQNSPKPLYPRRMNSSS